MAMNQPLAEQYETMESELRVWLSNLEKPSAWWSEEAIEIMLRANGYCEYCGADLAASPEAFWSSHYEHVLPPKSHGGEDDWRQNKALACPKCNSVKRDDLPEGVTADDMKQMEKRSDRIAAFRPMVLERRRKMHVIEVYARFRELLELRRYLSQRD
ncbi:MAG: HNH endonuclease signature motif containing protein [Planctomycetota bacterium]